MRTPALVFAFLSTAGLALAQAPSEPARAAPLALPEWLVPFHADTGTGDLWAAGPSYKARVAQGLTYYPRLGTAHAANAPLQWCTEDVCFGGASVLPRARQKANVRAIGQRAEVDHGAVLEVYEARREGIEQLFVVPRPPVAGTGDLEVVGRISGPLRGTERSEAHAALEFRDVEASVLVEYGAATAIDAGGRRLPIGSSLSDGCVRLRVPGAWLAEATWPVTIDPLIGQGTFVSAAAETASPQILRVHAQGRVFVGEARASAGSDWDVAVHAYDDGWNLLGTIYSDLAPLTSVHRLQLAVAEGENRLVVAAATKSFQGEAVLLYFHDVAKLVLNSGTSLTVPNPIATHDFEPSIGGSSGRYCYLAFRRDASVIPINTPQSRVLGAVVDAQTKTVGAPQDLHTLGGNNFDAERPQVSGHAESSGWVVVWQEYNYDNANDDWDVIGQRIRGDGTLTNGAVLGLNQTVHKLTPHVAGSSSRFLLAFVARSNENTKTTTEDGTALWTQRINWPTEAAPTLMTPSLLTSAPEPGLRLGLTTRATAFDVLTESLWAVAYQRLDTHDLQVYRIGYDGVFAEKAVLADNGPLGSFHSPSVCFEQNGVGFLAVYASSGFAGANKTYGWRFRHGPAAVKPAGVSCSGTVDALNQGNMPPHAGCESFAIRLQGGRASAPTILAVGATGSVPLPAGAAGCLLLLDPTLSITVLPGFVSQPNGSYVVGLPIPSKAFALGLVWQFVQLDLGRLWSSSAISTDVR